MRLFSIASGSSGNCIYMGNEHTDILVDAGVSGKRIIEGLKCIGKNLSDIQAILVTHEHSDHISGLGVILRKCPIPVYATRGTIKAVLTSGKIGKVDEGLFNPINPDQPFCVGEMDCEASSTWHDAADPVCYSFKDDSGKATIATDLGNYDDYLIGKIYDSDMMLVESNHDVSMLQANPRYSYMLKQRILSDRGHLSNEQSGELMTSVVKEHRVRKLALGHLSQYNNVPECALMNMHNFMDTAGAADRMEIQVAARDRCSVDMSI